MSFADYFTERVFRSPYAKITVRVGPGCVLWALLLGPIYYWRKQAPVEALLLFVTTVPLLGLADLVDLPGLPDVFDFGSIIWVGFAVAAPVLLPLCYRRKGWEEITRRPGALGRGRNLSESVAGVDD